MTKTLLTLNKPNLNGRIYTSDAVQKMIDSYTPAFIPVTLTPSGADVDIEKIIGVVEDIQIRGDILVGDVRTLDPYSELLTPEIHVRPAMIGAYEEDGTTIKELRLISFFLTNEPA